MGTLSTRLASSSLSVQSIRSAESAEERPPQGTRRAHAIQAFWLTDATRSMTHYIELVKARTMEVFQELSKRHPRIELSTGFYRDHDCTEPIQFFGGETPTSGEFTGLQSLPALQCFIEQAGYTEANGTDVEALGAGLYYASQLPWTARHRVLLHVGDQPSHGFADLPNDALELCPLRMTHERIIETLRKSCVRCFMVRCGGSPHAEMQYRDIAARTGGRYLDFSQLSSIEDILVFLEAAVSEVVGHDVSRLIEDKAKSGRLAPPAAQALLTAFTGRGR